MGRFFIKHPVMAMVIAILTILGTHTAKELEAESARFLEAARKRPEIGRAFTTFRAHVPQVFAKVDRDKVLKEGVEIGEVYSTLQASWGALTSTSSTASAASGASTSRAHPSTAPIPATCGSSGCARRPG
jgi:multidrug efflux pump subunit AcrB